MKWGPNQIGMQEFCSRIQLAPISNSHRRVHSRLWPPCVTKQRWVYEALDAQRPMKDTLRKLGISPSFHLATKLRLELTTSAFPYLRGVDVTGYKRKTPGSLSLAGRFKTIARGSTRWRRIHR